jgi:Uncharacterised protein family (UPF0236)
MDLSLLNMTLWGGVIRLLQAYFDWSHTQSHSLAAREGRLKRLFEELAEVLLGIDAERDEARVRPAACPCGGRLESKGKRDRTVVTTVGEVTVRRRYYVCKECGDRSFPLDEAWGIESGCLSARAKAEAVDLATALPHREACHWLERLGGIRVSFTTVWRMTQQAGAALVAAEAARAVETQERKGAAAFLARMRERATAGRPVMAVDGLYIRVGRVFMEVKIGVMGELSEAGEWVKGRTSYVATLGDVDWFRPMVVRHALARGITRLSEVVLLGDGAGWISVFRTRYYPNAKQVVDYWHAKQYLWEAAHQLYGEGSTQAAAWVEAMKGHLWKGEIEKIVAAVEAERKRRRIRDAKRVEALEKAMRYLMERSEQMKYETFRKQGVPTGSGAVEGGGKNVVQSRMKRSGMNWSLKGAEQMLALRARYCERLAAL